MSTQPFSEAFLYVYASFSRFPPCRYTTYFTCSFHLIELRRGRLAPLSETFPSRELPYYHKYYCSWSHTQVQTIHKVLHGFIFARSKEFCFKIQNANVEKMYRATPRGTPL